MAVNREDQIRRDDLRHRRLGGHCRCLDHGLSVGGAEGLHRDLAIVEGDCREDLQGVRHHRRTGVRDLVVPSAGAPRRQRSHGRRLLHPRWWKCTLVRAQEA